jgi:hypothetical protein
MTIRIAAVAALLLSCAEPAQPPAASPPPKETVVAPPPIASGESKPAGPVEVAPVSGTRTVVAQKTVDDSWDKMIVAGGRVYALTEVNKWGSGAMYVPAARLWSAPIGGGTLTKHLELEGLASLAADDAWLYVAVTRDLSTMGTSRANASTGRIFRMPLAGGTPLDLAGNIAPRVFALDGDTLWFDAYNMPKSGGKAPAPTGARGAMAFAFDDEYVYFTSGKGSGEPTKPDGKNGRILRMPKKGGAPTVLARGLPDEPSGLAVDGTHVYATAVTWGSPASESAGVIARVPKEGGDLQILGAQALPRAAWIAGDHVYVRSGRPGRPGSIVRVLKTGGAVETVVTDETLVSATMDKTSLYFTSDGTFRKEPFERLSPAVLIRLVR